MSIRFLADEDLKAGIVQGLRSREPAIDILDVKTAGLRGTKDPALLELADRQGRILITYDRRTMTRYFRDRLHAGKSSPGVFVFPQQRSAIGEIVEWLLLVWTASQVEEWRDRIVYLPLR
jgi:uncharacterized protein DUF5615